MDKKQLKHHAERLEKAIEQIREADEKLFEKAKSENLRMDFVRKWTLSPRNKKEKSLPDIYLYGTSIAQGKISAVQKLERDLLNTLRNIDRSK
ncbi:hypothetical protein [Flavobacterium sp.]|uniref:hypothetical protein n=1 Tax=Flavobacterium sp. TaxID=239 RepID=UPI001212865F|nr:hypothetical protein [Flavobacterium sp.]RZJ69807.1 MAG: hypothetical protein EOO49_16250 [Flavobacterium sp.]